MLGTAAITAPTSILYQQAEIQAGGVVAEVTYTIYLLYICMIYFGMLLVCTPISGGHFNPALTLSVFLTCPNKRDKISKLFMMITAQIAGGMIGLGLARLFRVEIIRDKAAAVHDFYPAYTASQSAIESVAPGADIAPVLLFCEVFASLLLCLVFLSLKYRKDLTDNGRDPVLGAAALAVSLFVVCSVTGLIIGDSLINPVVAFVEIL